VGLSVSAQGTTDRYLHIYKEAPPMPDWLPSLIALATLSLAIYGAIERVWLFAGAMLALTLIEVFLLARMEGPFEIIGRRVRIRGILKQFARGSRRGGSD
jgi:hypothetical protein